MSFRLVQELAADEVLVAVACRVLGVSTSGYYEWRGRPPSRAGAGRRSAQRHRSARSTPPRAGPTARRASTPSCGWDAACAAVASGRPADAGRASARHLPTEDGEHARPAPACTTTGCSAASPPTRPNRLWLTDITEHPTREGKVYCCCVLDVYSPPHRRLVDRRPPARRARRRRPGDGALAPPAARRPDRAPRGPRLAIHVLGLRPPAARGRPARLDGPRRLRAGQRDDGVLLRRPCSASCSTARRWATRATSSRRRSSSGSRPGTTRAAGTPASACSPRSTTKPFTPRLSPRHDHHTTRDRRTGSRSYNTRRGHTALGGHPPISRLPA